MDLSVSPFTVQLLRRETSISGTSFSSNFSEALPATNRTKKDDIVVPQAEDISFLERELLVTRLNDIQDWLWVCGRPMPPRPLHHQVLISRNIAVTESPELHLVWTKNRIFLKPMPLYLLESAFWQSYILQDKSDRHQELAACARGFMFSYCALVAYHSDFRIAQDTGLLPKEVAWENWKELSKQLVENHCFATVNPRYWYGELRLNRLNQVYQFRKGFLLRGYSRVAAHTVYTDLLRDNFAVLAAVLGYVIIVLTAMQVGLGVDRLKVDQAFQHASYGFTVLAIIAPLVAVLGIVVFVMTMFISNWLATKNYEGKRFRDMGVEPFWRNQPEDAATTSTIYDSLPES